MAAADKPTPLSDPDDLTWSSDLLESSRLGRLRAPEASLTRPSASGEQVALTGRLGRLNFPSILQFLVFIKKSGKLTVTNRNNQALILFRNGRIVYATSNAVRETLGSMLVCEKLITEETLTDALERQHRSRAGVRLGTILQEMGAVDAPTIERLVELQTEKIVYEVACWSDGFFKFELLDLPQGPSVTVDAQDFFLEDGVSAEGILYRVAGRIEDLRQAEAEEGAEPNEQEEPAVVSAAVRSVVEAMMGELRSPTFTAEATLSLQRDAAAFFDRSVLFLCRPSFFTGMAQVGVELEGSVPDRAVRELRLPANQPSILHDAVQRKETVVGPLADEPWNNRLLAALGGGKPQESACVPMTVGNEVIAVIYGDNLRSGRPISTDQLEERMTHLALAIERSILELRLQHLTERIEELE